MSKSKNYPKATTITIYSLGIFLGLLHIFLGVIAISPIISQDYHREMKINYNAFSKSLQFLHPLVDRVNLASSLRYLTAILQIVFGSLLMENGHFRLGSLSKIGNFGLIALDTVFFLLQLTVGSSYERIAPTIVFTVLLVTRVLILEQSGKTGVTTRGNSRVKVTPKKSKKSD